MPDRPPRKSRPCDLEFPARHRRAAARGARGFLAHQDTKQSVGRIETELGPGETLQPVAQHGAHDAGGLQGCGRPRKWPTHAQVFPNARPPDVAEALGRGCGPARVPACRRRPCVRNDLVWLLKPIARRAGAAVTFRSNSASDSPNSVTPSSGLPHVRRHDLRRTPA